MHRRENTPDSGLGTARVLFSGHPGFFEARTGCGNGVGLDRASGALFTAATGPQKTRKQLPGKAIIHALRRHAGAEIAATHA